MANMKRNPSYVLPDEIIDAILVRLPIKDAARTSILASDWKFKWETLSKLVFNNACLSPPTDELSLLQQLVYIVDSVLTLHVGPVQSFELSTDVPVCSDVSRWISFLSRNNVEEIILRFKDGEPRSLSSRLFNCEVLTYLELCHCAFKVPASFKQFAKLTTLKLTDVHDHGGSLEALITSCPSLRVLSVVRVVGPSHLNIVSGNLHEVYMRDVSCSFGYAPCLAKARFMFYMLDKEKIESSDLLSGLPNIQKLELLGFAIESFFSYGSPLQRLPARYDSLKTLHIEVAFQSTEEYMASLCLIRSFPNLEVLNIQVCPFNDADNTEEPNNCDLEFSSLKTEEPNNCDLEFSSLKTVKMADVLGTPRELHLIACFLRNAQLLKTIMISIESKKCVIDELQICKDLMRYQRASTQAEIIYMEKLVFSCAESVTE